MASQVGRRRRPAGWAVASVAVVAAAAGGTVASGIATGGKDNAGDANERVPTAAEVTRQTLVDTQTETGELSYGSTTSVSARFSGTVTGLPTSGKVVQRGQELYSIDNLPVLLLTGSLPAYRKLAPGTEGPDVEQFERNLRALGYTGFVVNDEYTSATAEAVEEWQEDLGLPETGTVELGRVYYVPGSIRIAEVKAALGDQAQPGKEVLTYSARTRVVTVELEMNEQRLARKGARVNLTLPDGKRVPARVTGVETVVDPGDDSGQGQSDPTTKLAVTIAPLNAKALAGLGDATIDVAFTVAERKNVLTVPVAALLALAEGGYGVEVIDGTSTRVVPVTTGMFANGRVEVSGHGLTEHTKVGMPA